MNSEKEINNLFALKFSRKTQLEELKECLLSLMNFVFSESQFQKALELSPNLQKPNSKRQNILREHGLLELLAQLVEKAFPTPYQLSRIEQAGELSPQRGKANRPIINAGNKSVSSRKSFWVATKRTLLESEKETILIFVEICKIAYELIKGICKENYENQIECFNYFKIFKKHIGFHLGATTCLISVLKSNEKLLLLIHNPEDELENLTQLLQKNVSATTPTIRSSFKEKLDSSMIHFFLERYEVLNYLYFNLRINYPVCTFLKIYLKFFCNI